MKIFNFFDIRKHIKKKILFFISLIFILTIIGIFIFSSFRLKYIISSEKEKDFNERIRVIIRALDTKNNELKKTGFVDAYKDFYQETIIKDLKESYYSSDSDLVPFIIDFKGKIVMHSEFDKGDDSLRNKDFIKKIIEKKMVL